MAEKLQPAEEEEKEPEVWNCRHSPGHLQDWETFTRQSTLFIVLGEKDDPTPIQELAIAFHYSLKHEDPTMIFELEFDREGPIAEKILAAIRNNLEIREPGKN